ncbi:hypothetical protein FB45DRAFT_929850 [Roridomyces roridus]|uniref:Uncharacterized protein n=1 Tax=Roridomyces roridus TaxID=1738132 RepID=A0AAD7FHH5_9AGAR|nr:hypothetical protein FB45DRAFT_929850 [Roridomyces roridus]
MSSNEMPSQAIMTSPVFRYAVLVVLLIVVVMAAGVCYRTRLYRRQILAMHPGLPTVGLAGGTAHDWGPKPKLFDVFLRPPGSDIGAVVNEKRGAAEGEYSWEDVMPISLTRGGATPNLSSSLAQVSVMISMPSSRPLWLSAHTPLPDDDENDLPHIEFGLADLPLLLPDTKSSTGAHESQEAAKSSV